MPDKPETQDASPLQSLRGRLEQPVERATELTRRTLAWFPVRVWRHFLQHNGFLLAAGVSYQALFAIVAALYVAFASTGLWLGANTNVINGLIAIINSYIPELISDNGLVTPEQVREVADRSASVFTITGIVALGVAIWTAIGFITFTRRAVRDIFVLPFDSRSYFLLKTRDLLAALVFGAALIAGSVLATVTSGLFSWIVSLLGPDTVFWSGVFVRLLSIVVAFAINTLALAGLFRFLAGTSLRLRSIMPGATLGGAGMALLQLGASYLFGYTPTNPLLATFAIFIGFLLWFRLNGIVILVAASWIAVSAGDQELPLSSQSEDERRAAEHAALLLTAQIRLREARAERADAAWWRRRRADRAVRQAADELARIEESAPPPPRRSSLFE